MTLRPALFFIPAVILAVFHALPVFTQEPGIPFPNSRFDTIDGFSVHYRVWNERSESPPGNILFVHGFAGSTFCFRDLYDTLAVLGYRVIAVDIPGAGYSSRSLDFNQSFSHRGIFLWKLIDQVQKGRPARWTLVGHSMGGGTAEAMAILRPEQTEKLILIAGTVFRKTTNLTYTATFLLRQENLRKILVDFADRNLITYRRFGKLLKSAYRRKPDSSEVLGYLTPLEIRGSAEALVNVYINNRETEGLDARNLGNVPVYAIWGTRDSWIPLRSARMYFNAFPIFALVKIKGAGHMPMETNIRQFIQHFLEFID